ncbi:HupE/UreJ family protein [Thalassomonas viridans]|uniref:HupE/UreJ family protein n=2 Tax=Thalassomonas viridans TaxID=137584 RepID=A0AAE9Z7V9_9GAMM|nr:HupE/UreJ family protein [Thalassomonas viridans]
MLLTVNANAHISTPSQASLFIISDNEYKLELQLDIVHLLQQETGLEDDDKTLIPALQQLPLPALMKALYASRDKLQNEIVVNFNGQPFPVNSVQAPSLQQVRQILASPPGTSGYQLTFAGYGDMPADTSKVSISFPEMLGDVSLALARPYQTFILAGKTSETISLQQGGSFSGELAAKITTFIDYTVQGVLHIIPKGLDHILFVLALFLLAGKMSTLLWQVSAFTLAHTITLALGIFGVVNLPASIVEPLIALSIAYVAVENIFALQLKKWRILVIFAFGLLHGLGFASVLLELGLAPGQYVLSLVAFNIGVELGQIAVILLAFACVWWWQSKDWYRQRIVQPLSLLVAVTGLYWFVERII